MLARTLVGTMGGGMMMAATMAAMTMAVGALPASAQQVSGRVVLASGPIGVSVVFGPERAQRVAYRQRVARPVRYEAPLPVRYQRGMSLWELERYLEHVEREYEVYRRMHPSDAYYYFGWTRDELRTYVRWLRDERRFLRDEHKRLSRLVRAEYRYDDRYWDGRPGRGHPGRGRGVARGNPHR